MRGRHGGGGADTVPKAGSRGAFVDVAGEVVKVGNTSLQIKICVVMDSQEEAEGVLAADALFVYVALDAEGKPGKVGYTSVLGGSCPDSGI